jgi:ATP-binding protein involved in chromosome partitioning
MSAPAATSEAELQSALATVIDPEIRRPITDLGMVKSATVRPDGVAEIAILLTVAACPLRDKLRDDVTAAVARGPSRSSRSHSPARGPGCTPWPAERVASASPA